MNKNGPLSPSAILSGLIVTVLGGILVAMLVGEGRFASPNVLLPVTITLTNEDCRSHDFRVDGQVKVLSLSPNATTSFQTNRGQHTTHACAPGTEDCGPAETVNWTTSTYHAISRSPQCPITISLTNKGCIAVDFYLDGELIVPSMSPSAQVDFQTTIGWHSIHICMPGTSDCAEPVSVEWKSTSTESIWPGHDCP